jgi:hypothetical protein
MITQSNEQKNVVSLDYEQSEEDVLSKKRMNRI